MIDPSPDAVCSSPAADASIAPQQMILDHLLAETVRRAHAKGERWTAQRSLVVRVLARSRKHLDADEVLVKAQAEETSMGRATVYRTLNQLVDLGIAERHRLANGPATFEITFGRLHHDHLVDRDTGETIEFRDPEIEHLQQKIARRLGYVLTDYQLVLFGVRRAAGSRRGAQEEPDLHHTSGAISAGLLFPITFVPAAAAEPASPC